MSRTYVFKTIPGLMKAAQSNTFTLYELLEGKFYSTGRNFKVTEQLKKELSELFAKAIWERKWKTKSSKLLNLRPCGILHRVYICKYQDKYDGRYCAGQDYPSEIRFIQKMVNNL